jgi:carboxypeptidase Taq
MYYQGIARELNGTRLWGAASPGVNESQSRLWENQVGRSLAFWEHFFPRLQATFRTELADQDALSYFRANNKVRPSYIRVDADEVTYNLHIMLRFELEKELLAGTLAVEDVPAAWNAKLHDYLGLPPPPDADGCLQDIHWCYPQLGQFVGYTLGNMIAAQLMEAVRAEIPQLDDQFRAGEFTPLLEWLHVNVHAHGRKFTPMELVERATGRPLSPRPLISYLESKFRFVYGLAEISATPA